MLITSRISSLEFRLDIKTISLNFSRLIGSRSLPRSCTGKGLIILRQLVEIVLQGFSSSSLPENNTASFV